MRDFVKIRCEAGGVAHQDERYRELNPAHIVEVAAQGSSGLKRFTLANNVTIVGEEISEEEFAAESVAARPQADGV